MDMLDQNLLQNPGYVAQRIAACELEIQKGMIGQHERPSAQSRMQKRLRSISGAML